jgi:hypothetical protein
VLDFAVLSCTPRRRSLRLEIERNSFIAKLFRRSCGLMIKRAVPAFSCDFPVFYWFSWFFAASLRL